MKSFPQPIHYYPQNPDKYVGNIKNIVMRSSYESKFSRWCDTNPNVIKWGSESIFISYYSNIDKKIRRYFPDFFIIIKDKEGNQKKFIIEIKPLIQYIPPKRTKGKKEKVFLLELLTYQKNLDKWKAAAEYAKMNRMGI